MQPDFLGLKGKTAIVWGGAAGMGEATARQLGLAGCRIAIADVNTDNAERAATKLRAHNIDAVAFCVDASNEDQVQKAVIEVEASLGKIELMVTVIGVSSWAGLIDMDLETWNAAHTINLTSFFLPARVVAKAMIKNRTAGSITCVSSLSGVTSSPNHGAYGAAKAAMIQLVRTMAVEWGPFGIRVNSIAPGAIETERVTFDENRRAFMADRLPLGRPGRTDEVAKAALFLASDLASYTTGHTLTVDGGWGATYLFPTPKLG